jgi:hypothetical protein
LLAALAIIVLPTIGLLVALLIIGSASSAPAIHTSSLPPTSVTVQLLSITCQVNENSSVFSRGDHFYMLGAFAVPSQNPKAPVTVEAMVTEPLPIYTGQSISYNANPPLLFAGMLPAGATIKGGLVAYSNDDASLDVSIFPTWSKRVATEMGKQLQTMNVTSGNLVSVAPAMILQLAVQDWHQAAGKANTSAVELGQQPLSIATQGAPSEPHPWHITSSEAVQTQGWDYTIRYQVIRSPLAPGTPLQPTPEQPASEQEALTSAVPAIILVSTAGDVAQSWRVSYFMTPERKAGQPCLMISYPPLPRILLLRLAEGHPALC